MSNAAEKQPDLFLKTVEVEISDEENTARLVRLAEVDNLINDTEAEKAGRVSDFNSELKQLRKERGKLLDSIKTRREKRDIECFQRKDERRGIMLTIRHHDGKVIDERALTAEERTEDMFDEERTPGHKEGSAGAADATGEEGDKAEADAAGEAAEAGESAPTEQPEAEPKKSSAGKVVRIRASDVKKKKADRDAKAKKGGK